MTWTQTYTGMTWIQTYTGRRFDFVTPNPNDIDIRDIARSLANQCRYGGHTKFHYSVAQHSCLLASYAREQQALGRAEFDPRVALMHDAAEAYTLDIPRPLKKMLVGFAEIEAQIESLIFAKFGLAYPLPHWLHIIDGRIINDERSQVTLPTAHIWPMADSRPLKIEINPISPSEAFQWFMLLATHYGMEG